MSRMFGRGALSSRAALEGRPVGDPEENAEVVETTAVPEEILELNEAEEEVTAIEDDAAEIDEAAEALESLRSYAVSALEDRGLTPREAVLINSQANLHLKRLDESMVMAMPSQEAFGGEDGKRLQSTRVSIEGLKDQLIRLWDWLVGLFNDAKRSAVDYYQRVWAQAPRQAKTLEGLLDKIDASTKTPDSDKNKVKLSKTMVAKLSVDGKMDGLPANLGKVQGVADALFTGYVDKAVAWAGDVTERVSGLDFSDDEKFQATIAKVTEIRPVELPAGLLTKEATGKQFEGVEGVTFRRSEILPGDQAVVGQIATVAEGGGAREIIAAIGKNQLRMQDMREDGKSEVSEKEETVASLADLKNVAQAALKLAKTVEAFKRNWEKTDTAKSSALSKLKPLRSKLNTAKELSGENQSTATAALRLIGAVPGVVDQPNRGFSRYILNVNASVISYLEKSVALYKA